MFRFEILHKSKRSSARVGRLITPHGIVETPNFVAVGTNGTIKALDNKMVDSIGLQLIFCNTYHLLLQPGTQVIEKSGGVHKFINRTQPIITDSGGFQVFSLAYGSVHEELKRKGQKQNKNSVLKISEEGVIFRSYIDGKKIILTPESSIQAQKSIGADIIIPFDELPPYHTNSDYLFKSLERTHRWEERSLKEHLKDKKDQAIYGVVHGGINKNLREKSANFLSSLAFDGYAIGGSFGKDQHDMVEMLNYTIPILSDQKPIHLLGIGDLLSIPKIISLGIDTFDSSYPTKAARHGTLFTKEGHLKINKRENINDFSPIEEKCSCYTCQNYSRAYLNHLFKANELTYYSLSTIHNLHFLIDLMHSYRHKISNDEI